jgi:hypothetical protein
LLFTGRLSQDRRGIGSIIGAVFLILILLSGYAFYTLNFNVTRGYTETLQDMQQLDLERNRENIEFVIVSFNLNELNITVRNTGSCQSHLIWLGIFNETVTPNMQHYYKIDFYVNPAETVPNVGNSSVDDFEGQERVIQLVTELGNTFSYAYPPSGGESAQIYDFVDSNSSDVDLSPNKGTHSFFPAMKAGPDGIYDVLTEGNAGGGGGSFGYTRVSETTYTSIFADRMYGSLFTSPADSEGATISSIIWYGRRQSGAGNAKAVLVLHSTLAIIAVSDPVSVSTTGQERTCTFSSPPTISANTEYILMMIFDSTTRLYYASGSTNQGHYDTSNDYTAPTDPTDAVHNNNQYCIRANYDKPNSYNLDLEVQWTNVNFNEENEWLSIYCDIPLGSERILVDVWNSTEWINIIPNLSNGWNSVDVSFYLTSSTFTIRFIGGTEFGDSILDSWEIDAAFLYVWTEGA